MKNLYIEIKWALLFTTVSILWMFLEKASGLHDQYIDYQMYLTKIFAIPAILMMYLALKEKKNRNYQGQMSYKQGFISGCILAVMIGVLSPLYLWISLTIISPHYFETAISHSVETGYFKSVAEAEGYFNFNNYLIEGSLMSVVMGVVTTAIIMIFLKKKTQKPL